MEFLTTEQQVIGNPLLIEFTLRTYAGALADPTDITVKVKLENGDAEEFESGDLLHPSTGVYQLEYTPAAQGRYYIRLEATGTVETAQEWKFDVGYSLFV